MSVESRTFSVLFALMQLGCSACERSSPNLNERVDAGGDAGSAFSCITNWPTRPAVPATASSLTATPRLLWTRQSGYTDLGMEGGVVLGGNTLAIATGFRVVFFNQSGESKAVASSLGQSPSAPVADKQGRFYVATANGARAFDESGKKLWEITYGSPSASAESFAPPPFALGPDGVLYGAGADHVLRAIRAESGTVVWARPVPAPQFDKVARVMGGAGDAIFLRTGTGGVEVRSRKDGALLGHLRNSDGRTFITYEGLWMLGYDLNIGFGTALVLDRCGKQRWTTWVNNLTEFHSGVVTASERMFESKWTTDAAGIATSPQELALLNFQGQVEVGPKSGEGVPLLAGADGTVYTKLCQSKGAEENNQVIAYSPDLSELWRVAIGPGCPAGQAVLDDAGVMYLVREGTIQAGGTVLLAIQTNSPGLAKSSWPNLRRDNEGSSWLAP